MIRPTRDRLPTLALAVLAVLLAAGPVSAGPEARKGSIGFQARLEPADLGPGGEGVLVVTSVIEHELHVYVDGDEAVRFKPLPVEGVTYHVADPAKWTDWAVYDATPARVTWSKPILRPIPGFPNAPPDPVWEEGHDFEIRVPVTLSADVAADAELGLVVDYSACDEATCYARIRGTRVTVSLGAAPKDPSGVVPPVAAAKPTYEAFPQSDAASVSLAIEDGPVAVVTFTPSFGYYVHGPDVMSPDIPLTVEPLEDAGITWGDWDFDAADEKIKTPYAVRIPFEKDGAKQLRIRVGWQGCDEVGQCDRPQEHVLVARWAAVRSEPPVPLVDPNEENGAEPPVSPPAPPSEVVELQPGEKGIIKPSETLPFPVILGDDLDKPRTDDDWREVGDPGVVQPASDFEEKWEKYGILVLGIVFVFGIGLAFTPCVLPIIPLTISVIGGGNPDIKKSRLTLLLSVYVLGLTLTYGAAGAAAGFLGEAINLAAAFENPAVIWTIALIFIAMAAGMMGFFELQPPAWMERMRGGAQRKSGTVIGSFLLGILAAVIASPCTGPFVVGMIAFAATKGPLLGFLLFSMLGLGMGAVFFAAGSLNLLARPGPWMVWVRYAFGVILFGFALYLLANSGQLDNVIVLFAVGFVVALVGWWAIARHLVRTEGERMEVARMRGAVLAVCLIITTGVVAFLTRQSPAEGWIKIQDVAHLEQEVERATKEKRPVVVKVGATWCTYCKAYDGVIAADAYLRDAFGDMVRLKIDVEKDARDDLREAVGLPGGQPKMVFFDEFGRIRRAADIQEWHGEESDDELKKRVDFLFWRNGSASAGTGDGLAGTGRSAR
jgi:thiol:disulfide interchange protein DsbD